MKYEENAQFFESFQHDYGVKLIGTESQYKEQIEYFGGYCADDITNYTSTFTVTRLDLTGFEAKVQGLKVSGCLPAISCCTYTQEGSERTEREYDANEILALIKSRMGNINFTDTVWEER